MKRKTILSALFSAIVACFFVACSNDSDALDINAGTRSATSSSYMTREEVQTRLDEIGEKYGTQVIIDEKVNIDLVSADIFTKLEEHLSSKQKTKANRINTRADLVNETSNDSLLMNDSSIDDIMLMAAPPSGETVVYTGTFTHELNISCGVEPNTLTRVLITWHTNSSSVQGTLSLSAQIEMGHGSGVLMSFSDANGSPASPSFKYSGMIECHTAVLVPYYEYIYVNEVKCDSVLNYRYDSIDDFHSFSGNYPKQQ